MTALMDDIQIPMLLFHMFSGMMVISVMGKKETMNNSELTRLIKDTAKDGYLVSR